MWRPAEGRREESARCERAPSPWCSQASPSRCPPAAARAAAGFPGQRGRRPKAPSSPGSRAAGSNSHHGPREVRGVGAPKGEALSPFVSADYASPH